jgi:hypothetical protein
MALYLAHGCLYFLSTQATQAQTYYDLIVARATAANGAYGPDDIYSSEVLSDGVTKLSFWIRFKAQTNQNQLVNAAKNLTDKLDLTYFSYIEWQVAHDDVAIVGPSSDMPPGTVGETTHKLEWGTRWANFK